MEIFDENWKWIQEYWKTKSELYGVTGWTFGLNRRKTSIALTNFTKKTVTVSKYFLSGSKCSQSKMKNAVLHEIAHIIAGYSAAHGQKWKEVARQIGCDGEICGQMDQPPYNYILTCHKNCFQKGYYRHPQIKGKVCKHCNGTPLVKKL